MKHICTLLLTAAAFLIIPNPLSAQTGPGGVGSSANNIFWYDAAQLTGVNNGNAVQTFTDFSGNNRHATQSSAGSAPTYITAGPNGKPALQFDGTNDFLQLGSTAALNSSRIQWFIVSEHDNLSSIGMLLSTATTSYHTVWGTYYHSNTSQYRHFSRSSSNSPNFVNLGYSAGSHIFYADLQRSGNLLSGYMDQSLIGTTTGVNFIGNHLYTRLGSGGWSTTGNQFLDGTISEAIAFSGPLNSAELNIIHNYLGAKYNIGITNDLYAFETTHEHEVAGIGREDASNLQTDARGSSILRINSPSDLGNGEYMLWGHDGAGLTSNFADVPATYSGSRFNQVWRVSETGDVGTVTLIFDLSANQIGDTGAYELLVDDDGVFSSGATGVSGTYDGNNQTLTFTVNLDHGDYFTIGNNSQIISITSGPWHDPQTWNCTCIPGANASVTVDTGDVVTIEANASIGSVTIAFNGTLTFNDTNAVLDVARDMTIETGGTLDVSTTNNRVEIAGNWLNNGTFTHRLGEVVFDGTTGVQTIDGGVTPWYDLTLNNPTGVSLESGSYTLVNTLTINDGVFITNDFPFVILSNTTATGRIAAIPAGSGIEGRITVQRFLPAGNADYRNVASPFTDATLNMWDEPNIYMSGPGFPDGCAVTTEGCFASVKKWDAIEADYTDVTDYNHTLVNMDGYAIFLGDNLNVFSGATFSDVTGHINGPGNIMKPLFGNPNWLYLVGNPYASGIDFDLINKTGVHNWYYIFDQSTGNFEWYSNGATSGGNISTQGIIASGQGFWVEKSAFTSNLVFEQGDKVSQSGPFVRKYNPDLERSIKFDLYSNHTPLRGNVTLLFTPDASDSRDEQDIPHLPFPEKLEDYVSVTALTGDGNQLRRSSMPVYELTEVTLAVTVTKLGTYYLEPANLENFNTYSCITVEDLETGKIYDVSSGQPVPLEVTKLEDKSPRLVVRLSSENSYCVEAITAVEENPDMMEGLISIKGEYVEFDLPEPTRARITVVNLLGQVVHRQDAGMVSNERIKIDARHLNGIHLIMVEIPGKMVSGKSYLNKY